MRMGRVGGLLAATLAMVALSVLAPRAQAQLTFAPTLSGTPGIAVKWDSSGTSRDTLTLGSDSLRTIAIDTDKWWWSPPTTGTAGQFAIANVIFVVTTQNGGGGITPDTVYYQPEVSWDNGATYTKQFHSPASFITGANGNCAIAACASTTTGNCQVYRGTLQALQSGAAISNVVNMWLVPKFRLVVRGDVSSGASGKFPGLKVFIQPLRNPTL